MTAMGLTKRQDETLRFLFAYQMQHGTAPTFAEIATAIGSKSKSRISEILIALEERRYIRRLRDRPRAIEILIEPDLSVPVSAESLPLPLQERLAAFCARHGENPANVLYDAILIHIDTLEARLGV